MKVDIKNIKKIIGEEIAREIKTNKKLAEMGMQPRLHAMNMPTQNPAGDGSNPVDVLGDIFSEVRDENISNFGGDSSTLHGLGVDVGWQPENDDFVEMAKRFAQTLRRMPTAQEWKNATGTVPNDSRLLAR